MALVLLSRQDDYDLTNSDQDCRGWTVRDAASGNTLGKVADMMIDTETEHVDSIVLDTGAKIRAADIALRDSTVLVNSGGAASATAAGTRAGADTMQEKLMPETAVRDAGTATGATGEVTLPVIEERIAVGKRQVERGGVRVNQRVTERPVEETVRLREEHVHVERRPLNQPVDASNMEAFKEGVIEVTETAEEAVVSKQARVVEEVVVTK
ncbi:MAG TPA: YsnF/AvaK domain-containing protein, partial [Pyrinomonadaceae bacterium]|nr:YsnF/AvaK domain-containing protein [Pyrinomonadaceae bacterium]